MLSQFLSYFIQLLTNEEKAKIEINILESEIAQHIEGYMMFVSTGTQLPVNA
jgi:hypothetical protein